MTAAEWNEKYPVGTPVRYWTIKPHDGPGCVTETRSVAWNLGGDPQLAMVLLGGVSGCYALTHVQPVEDGDA